MLDSRRRPGISPLRATTCLLALLTLGATMASAASMQSADQRIVGRDASGAATFLKGSLGFVDPDLDPSSEAKRFLSQFAVEELGAAGDETLETLRTHQDEEGYVHTRLRQTIHGLPVLGSQVVVHADALTGEVYAVSGRFVSSSGLASSPTMNAHRALEVAARQAGIIGKALDDPELVYVLGTDQQASLAWRNRVQYESEAGPEIDDLFADAATGELVARHPRVHRAKNWRTHDGNNGSSLPGSLACSNGQSCGDTILQNIHNNSSSVYDYYKAQFGRNSYSGSDSTINSTGHHLFNYSNAFWNGSFLVYGDGNGSQSGPLGNAFDIVAHEFTHAVTDFESDLIYQNESGALNEAWSDIFAASAEAWADGGVSNDTWKIGEDTWTPAVVGDALRYMNNPTQDGSSRDYYPERYTGSADNGGVHWNSGIANLAYYLAARGGTHPRGKTTVNVTAIGLWRAEQIFYRAQTTYLTPSSNFLAGRNATGQAAEDLYGATYRDHIYTAWCAVGVGTCPASATNGSQYITQSVPTTLSPGQTTSVSVTMKNTGSTTWTQAGGYKLGSQNPQDNLTWGLGRIALGSGSIAPGQQKTFTFNITAPSSPGTYNFQWRMVEEGVAWFGAYSQNRQIVVSAGGSDNAQYIAQSAPTSMTPGQTASVSVTMKNTGSTSWTRAAGYKLGSQNPQGNTTWGFSRVLLPNGVTVAPGQQRTFTFTITAPSSPGTYNFQWKMLKEGVAWFGASSANRQISVAAGTNNAQYISQSVPSTLNSGQYYSVSVTMKNTGTTTWTRATNHKLGSENPRDNTTWNLNRVKLPVGVSVAPGQQHTFTFTIQGPKAGTHNFQWRMLQESVQWFGAFSQNRQIVVN